MNEEIKGEVSQELCVNDHNSSDDSRDLVESVSYDNIPFEKDRNSSPESRSQEVSDPYETVDKLGSEMKDLFSNWSREFLPSKEFEEDTMKRLDDLKKQAYILEAEFLESKLELVKKRITET